MKFVARTWSPAARLVIYRTFLQPILDYGAPLLALHSLDINKPSATIISHQAIWTDITDAHNRAIAWVLHQKTYTRILHSILGWEPICERFYSALLTLKHNSTDNPHLFPRLPNIPLLSQFRHTERASNIKSPLAWKQFPNRDRYIDMTTHSIVEP